MQLVLEKVEGGLFLEHCFSGEVSRPYSTTISHFPVFPKVLVLLGGSSISRLVPGFPKVGAKEAERAQGQPKRRHNGRLVNFLLFEQN